MSQRPEGLQPVRGAGDRTVTVIGSGARLEGNLVAAASLRIEGVVAGTITAEGDVIVAPEAEVTGDIKAKNVTLGGHYSGNVVASGTIELTGTARVEGGLTSRSLVINHGALFSGQSVMELGKKPGDSKPAAVTPLPPVTPGTPAPPTTPQPANASGGHASGGTPTLA
ncbi:MAG: hypothetical protein NVSMB32_08360 [Actinomycetota bacterium]